MFMKNMRRLPVFLLFGLAAVSAAAPADFAVESPTHGTKFKLSGAKSQVIVLHFLLKTECPVCLKHTREYAAKSAANPEVIHLFLKPDSTEEIKKWASHLDAKDLKQLPVIYRDADAKLARAFNIPFGYQFHGQTVHFPALVAIDRSGKELFRYVGKNNSDRLSYAQFEKLMAEKLGSKPPR
jgi:peroxiredoxin Q/BCP